MGCSVNWRKRLPVPAPSFSGPYRRAFAATMAGLGDDNTSRILPYT